VKSRQQIFSADSNALDLRRVFLSMIEGMRGSHYVAYRLVLRDVRSEYAKSALGIFWDFADPLVLGLVFYALRQSNVINPGEMTMPYSIFIIYGLLLYLTFSDSVLLSTNMMVRSKGIRATHRIPAEAMIQSVFFRVLFNFSFRLAAMLIFSIILYSSAKEQGLSTFSPGGFIAFLALSPMLMLAGMSIGTILAPLQAIYNDVARVVRLILVPLRFVSPVMWTIPATGNLAYINLVNPVGPLIDGLRSLATHGTLDHPDELIVRCALFAALFVLGWFVFHVTVPVLADK
jgi:ABC-type polysaccharide/polyol phosphate export permease